MFMAFYIFILKSTTIVFVFDGADIYANICNVCAKLYINYWFYHRLWRNYLFQIIRNWFLSGIYLHIIACTISRRLLLSRTPFRGAHCIHKAITVAQIAQNAHNNSWVWRNLDYSVPHANVLAREIPK